MRTIPSLCILSFLALACSQGCSAGGEGDGMVQRIASEDDSRLDALGIICESRYVLSGSFVPSILRPADKEGDCWPVGTWSVQATLEFRGCDPQKSFGDERVYEISVNDQEEYTLQYPKDPANARIELNVLSHGGSDCEGQFDHYEADNSAWTLRPVLSDDGTISGSGSYSLFLEDPYSN